MKNKLRYIAFIAMFLVSLQTWAETETETVPYDTVYFYRTWQQMLDLAPAAMMVEPIIEAYTPYEVDIYSLDEEVNEMLLKEYIAASLGDSIMLINTQYLKDNFKGDVKKLNCFAPVFFNEKVAYVQYAGSGNYSVSLSDILFGPKVVDGEYVFTPSYFYIDFANRKVLRVDHKVLSRLLGDYHNLQMRYEGMKDYKKDYIIEDYFFKFIDRASVDVMRPNILDLVSDSGIE